MICFFKKRRERIYYTKIWVSILLISGLAFMEQSYILAFLGRDVIAEGLSKSVCKIIIGTIIPYLCKSFFETYFEKRNSISALKKEIKGLKEKNKSLKLHIQELENNVNSESDSEETTTVEN